jgi:hypothetical protein
MVGGPDAINYCIAGVFEGGSAEGIAYGAALAALADQRCWFGAVAGAITAVLVAAQLKLSAGLGTLTRHLTSKSSAELATRLSTLRGLLRLLKNQARRSRRR